MNEGIFTTLVRVRGSEAKVVPVKSEEAIDFKLFIECSKALSRIYVSAPIACGEIICKNILNTGINIICTKSIK